MRLRSSQRYFASEPRVPPVKPDLIPPPTRNEAADEFHDKTTAHPLCTRTSRTLKGIGGVVYLDRASRYIGPGTLPSMRAQDVPKRGYMPLSFWS